MFGRKKEITEKKKEKKQGQPKKNKTVYTPIGGIMGMGEDYHMYKMVLSDHLCAVGLGAVLGLAVGYVFFDSLMAAMIIFAVAAVKMQELYREYLRKRRLKKLLLQFKDLLETLTSSYSAGQTTAMAFRDAQKEMTDLYGEDADIVQEIKMINTGLVHNYNIEDLLLNFAARSGLEDVDSFANVFEVCNRRGGNLKKIVGETRSVINDKIEIEMEIQTMVAASKNELNVMMVMPFIIMLSMRGLGENMTGNSMTNLIVKFVALGIFVGAYKIGDKMVSIKL